MYSEINTKEIKIEEKNWLQEKKVLLARLAEAEETLQAIRNGEIDALVIWGKDGDQIFTLKGAEHPYRLFVEEMNQGAVTLTTEGTILYCNHRFADMLGISLEYIIGNSFFPFVKPDDLPLLKTVLEQSSQECCKVELSLQTRNGSLRSCELALNPILIEHLKMICLVATDLTSYKQVEEQLKASLYEKEALLKEVHHRVKNNLQIISSLLKLQSHSVQEPKTLALFRESQNRVKSMALIHEKLYQTKNLSRIDFAEYIQSLVTHLFRTYRVGLNNVNLTVKAIDVWLSMDQAIPCGLLVNELISNSLKYAFPTIEPPLEKGEIKIVLEVVVKEQNWFSLLVEDNGIGLPLEVDPYHSNSFGMVLVRTLVEQLDGQMEFSNNTPQGVSFKFSFKLQNKR
ncbi:MAG: histidine kinase dimerization/phosphoacceptor domain -containing protein [Chloroflexota bacterium]|nr:PAS domain S-box protein [Chloroflexota bacterium]